MTVVKMYCVGAWYVCFYRLGIDWIFANINRVGLKWRNLIIWQKNNHNLSNSDYKSLYEPIIRGEQFEELDEDELGDSIVYGWINHYWKGNKKWKDIWRVEKTKKNKDHPTQKPVQLITNAISTACPKSGKVLDIFLGSGSTLIACEKTNRICYGMELDPKFIDLIIKRYEDYTGDKAIKI